MYEYTINKGIWSPTLYRKFFLIWVVRGIYPGHMWIRDTCVFSQIVSNEMSKHWQFNGSFLTVPVFLQRSFCQIPAIGVFHIQLVGRQGNWPR